MLPPWRGRPRRRGGLGSRQHPIPQGLPSPQVDPFLPNPLLGVIEHDGCAWTPIGAPANRCTCQPMGTPLWAQDEAAGIAAEQASFPGAGDSSSRAPQAGFRAKGRPAPVTEPEVGHGDLLESESPMPPARRRGGQGGGSSVAGGARRSRTKAPWGYVSMIGFPRLGQGQDSPTVGPRQRGAVRARGARAGRPAPGARSPSTDGQAGRRVGVVAGPRPGDRELDGGSGGPSYWRDPRVNLFGRRRMR
jgi:hypothetical protein